MSTLVYGKPSGVDLRIEEDDYAIKKVTEFESSTEEVPRGIL